VKSPPVVFAGIILALLAIFLIVASLTGLLNALF